MQIRERQSSIAMFHVKQISEAGQIVVPIGLGPIPAQAHGQKAEFSLPAEWH